MLSTDITFFDVVESIVAPFYDTSAIKWVLHIDFLFIVWFRNTVRQVEAV